MKPVRANTIQRFIAAAVLLGFSGLAHAQTPATMSDFGAAAPVPGTADISQLSVSGDQKFPDGLNYYTDNQSDHNAGEPGQTFTTGNTASTCTLTNLYLKSAGLDFGGGSPGNPINYVLHFYTVSGGIAALMVSYVSANPTTYIEGDWVRWSGLSVALSPNTTYAYSFGKAAGGGGWDAIGVAGGSPCAGGEIGLISPAGGAITFGGSHQFDAAFDLAISAPPSAPAPSVPSVSPTNAVIYAGTVVMLTETASGLPTLFYQWRTDGGAGGNRTNILHATNSTLAVNTTGFPGRNYRYDVVVSNSYGAATSSVAVLSVAAPSPPVLASDISPSSAVDYVGGAQTFSASFNGTLPITYQWQVNSNNIPNATNASITLSNLQLTNAGSYRALAKNSQGGPVASSAAQLTMLASAPYPGAINAASPIGYWRLNETASPASGSLQAADAAGNFNGTYGAAAADGIPGPAPALGFPGFENGNTAAEFTNGAANSFVTLPALNLNANTVTITAWIYPIGTPADYCGLVFCRPNGDASGLGFTSNGQLGYTWNGNNQDTWSWMSGIVPPQSQWSFVALVVSPGGAVVYLCNNNGVSTATNAIPHTAEAFNDVTLIGGDSADNGNGGRTFNGQMDEVAIFNTALTPQQVFNLYFSGAGGAPRVFAPVASPSNNVFAGTTVTLNSLALGEPPFSYQWQSNGVSLPGATGASLILTDAQAPDSGAYDVIVTNSSGSNISPALTLVVNPASGPIFTQEPAPASLTNYVNGLASFSAAAGGSPPMTFQWAHDGTNLPGQTAASLTLPNLQVAESGTYTLLVSNALGTNLSTPAVLTVLPLPVGTALNLLTYHNDNTRQGANTNEFLLTLANVNVTNFGLLFRYPLDGYAYATPLYVSGVAVPGQGTRNVVYAATEHNSLYAFDADSNTGTNGGLLWHTNFGPSALSSSQEFGTRYHGGNYTDLVPEVGITGTPVINLAAGTLYVDVLTRDTTASATNYNHRIHALNITNGAEMPFSPVIVSGSVPGTGVGGNGTTVPFDPIQHLQRPALTLVGNMLYVAYGSYADTDPYHGWVFGFNATTLQRPANYIFNTTPNATVAAFQGNAGEGALWMGGNGLCADANSNLYFEVANGSFSQNTNGGDYGDSFVKLSTTNTLAVADYFTPAEQASLQAGDEDLGSGGAMMLPDSVGSAAHPHLLVGCGKEGKLHLVDRDNMGHFNPNNDNQIVQEVPGAVGGTWSSPAYFNHLIYYQGSGDIMKAFYVSNAVITGTPVTQSSTAFGFPGATPAVSANGTNNGIAWIIQADAYTSSGPAVLHAYNATNLAQELYNSSMNLARDNPGAAVKMNTPAVVNGKVYVGAEYALSVYGNSVFLATPSISPAGGLYTNLVAITLADSSPGASIYYTLDGTAPTTNSLFYTGPFVLAVSAGVQAVAIESGATPSGVAQASFVNSASLGQGTGLTGSYYANHTSANPFAGTPSLVRTDAAVNFVWNTGGPGGGVGQSGYTVRWMGSVQPQFSENYTFYATADDGVRLWINGQEIINGWINQPPTTYQASIPLVAQQLYNVEMDFYYQNDGGAEAQLAWSSPSTPQAVIPRSQLYPYTNPPPTIVLTNPAGGSTFTAAASISLDASAAAPYNPVSCVSFFTNGVLAGSVSNAPYDLTATGFAAGSYILTATATDGSGLAATSAPVAINVTAGSGLPYGLSSRAPSAAFYNMPPAYTSGPIPTLLSATGVFANTPAMVPVGGLIPYAPNTPLWSDNALKIRYLSVPFNGGPDIPSQQIGFAPTGSWSFPSGTIFVKTFELLTNQSDPSAIRRLETRLIVRDTNGAVYGVTYKWLPDNSDAVLLSNSLSEAILITNAGTGSSYVQNWYYPSPADCLTCHTAPANYVLGVNTRQLNGTLVYSNGTTDNQLRALNYAGLFSPAFNESQIAGFEQLSSVANTSASLTQRARSYLDANCAQCHQPNGAGRSFDARYDTPLASQNIINGPVVGNLGYDNAAVVVPSDIWRSILYDRMNTLDPTIKMPPLARNLIDTNAVQVMAAWINSLGGTPALAPPVLAPAGGLFTNSLTLTLQPPDANAVLYYTLDGTLPTTNSIKYRGPFGLSSSGPVTANAFEPGYVNSVAVSGLFTIVPPLDNLFAPGFAGGGFQMQFWAPAGQTYILQGSSDLMNWTSLSTNAPSAVPFSFSDSGASNFPSRFYRVIVP
ncbi:MAG TPA: chitobiase/beta-hexosaminidase C-terminal domain-containing protein [Verrucomicrobiae bacterium]|jgi:uncharacterized repeat protein (TIGR03806 family)